jgi:hypothetical protein
LKRGDEVHSVNPGQTFELLDGDILAIATRVSITSVLFVVLSCI